MTPASELRGLLRPLRRRLVVQLFWREAGVGIMLAAGVALFLAIGEFLGGWRFQWPQALGAAAILLGGAILFAAVRTWLGTPTWPRLAALLDHLGGTRDRLVTVLALPAAPQTPMDRLVQKECLAYLQGRDFRALLPWRLTRAWRWLLVPVVAVALVRWSHELQVQQEKAEIAAAQEEVAPTVAALRALAEELKKSPDAEKQPELQRLAAELQARAEKLAAEAKEREAAAKSALGEISALEQLAQEMQRGSQGLSPEDLQALAHAMEQAEATQKAAERLRAGDPSAAAQELERAAREAAQSPTSSAAQAAAALQKALEQLAQQKQLSDAAQRQLASGSGSGEQNALQRLSEMLRQMPQQSGQRSQNKSGAGGQNGDPQSLERLLAALQNLKSGQAQPSAGEGQPGEPGQAPPSAVQVMPKGSGTAGDPAGQAPIPAANPGGDRDTGTTDTPFGAPQESARKGADLAVNGDQSEAGETNSQFLPGGGLDTSRATRQYRQLYENLAPAAESAVLQEDIPLGSRLYIKRYFESIRPVR